MSCWNELRIEPTDDTRAIKHAYAKRMKVTRPDDDPAGFMRLRDAYQQALGYAEWKQSGAEETLAVMIPAPLEQEENGTSDTEPCRRLDANCNPAEAKIEKPNGLPSPDRPAKQQDGTACEDLKRLVADEIARGKVQQAAECLAGAIDAGELSLADEMALKDQVLVAALNTDLPVRVMIRVAELFDWRLPPEGRPPHTAPIILALNDRIEAFLWFEKLKEDASSKLVWLGHQDALIARMMLGTKPSVPYGVFPLTPQIFKRFSELNRHGGWLSHLLKKGNLDKAWTERLLGYHIFLIAFIVSVLMAAFIVDARWAFLLPAAGLFLMGVSGGETGWGKAKGKREKFLLRFTQYRNVAMSSAYIMLLVVMFGCSSYVLPPRPVTASSPSLPSEAQGISDYAISAYHSHTRLCASTEDRSAYYLYSTRLAEQYWQIYVRSNWHETSMPLRHSSTLEQTLRLAPEPPCVLIAIAGKSGRISIVGGAGIALSP